MTDASPDPSRRSSRRDPATRLPDADRRILYLLAEHRALCTAHIAVLLGVGTRAADARLKRLAAEGRLDHRVVWKGYPPTCTITRTGLRAVGSRLPVPKEDFRGYRHDLGVGWLWLAAREGTFGTVAELRSEREMRSSDRRADRDGPALGVGLGFPGPKGYEQRHYPDLLMTLASGHRVAVELELTVKSTRRLDGIMRGYASDRRIDAVLYLTDRPAVRAAIEAAAHRVGVADIVHVQRLAPGSPHGAPEPARVAGRSLGREGRDARGGRVGASSRSPDTGR